MQEQAYIQSSGAVQHGTDKGLFAQFYIRPVEDEERSKELGRPFYRDVDYVKIIIPADPRTVVERPVRLHWEGNQPPDNERWPQKYEAFKNQKTQVEEGTPITEWPPLTPSLALMLKGMNIHTVEALASVNDSALQNIGMGAMNLREKARGFLEEAESGAGMLKLQDENADLKLQIEGLKNQMKGLGADLAQIKTAPRNNVTLLAQVDEGFAVGNPQVDFTPTTAAYGRRGRKPKQPQENEQ